MENFVIILVLVVTTFYGISGEIKIKTFYNSDLETAHIFYGGSGLNKLCNFFSEFYDEVNDKLSKFEDKLPKCIRFKQTQTLYCNGEMENFKNYTNKPKLERIENLIICYHNTTKFHANILQYFKGLKNLFIGYSPFYNFIGNLPMLKNLTFINITETGLKVIKSDFFKDLPSIRTIDLRSNQLNVIEKLHFSSDIHHRVHVYLHRNQWDCGQKILKWLVAKDSKLLIPDLNILNCSDSKFQKRPLELVMNFKIELKSFCKDEANDLKNCTCHVSYLRHDETTRSFKPVVSVICSSRGFYNFPKKLPPYTNSLHLDNNSISSLDALCFKNSTYTSVHDIYLDYNKIADAMVLDNCAWFDQFRVLSLRGNQLDVIPVFSFFNSFEKSHHALKLYLSKNPWECSCTFAPRLLRLCQQYSKLIVDHEAIKCHHANGHPELIGKPIMEITPTDVCKDYIPLNSYEKASIIFSVLIVIVVVNFLIDYYRYKNYGKLPWIVLNTPFF